MVPSKKFHSQEDNSIGSPFSETLSSQKTMSSDEQDDVMIIRVTTYIYPLLLLCIHCCYYVSIVHSFIHSYTG